MAVPPPHFLFFLSLSLLALSFSRSPTRMLVYSTTHVREDESHASERKHMSPCHLASKWSRHGSREATRRPVCASQARELFLEHDSDPVYSTRAQPPESSVSRIFSSCRERDTYEEAMIHRETIIYPSPPLPFFNILRTL